MAERDKNQIGLLVRLLSGLMASGFFWVTYSLSKAVFLQEEPITTELMFFAIFLILFFTIFANIAILGKLPLKVQKLVDKKFYPFVDSDINIKLSIQKKRLVFSTFTQITDWIFYILYSSLPLYISGSIFYYDVINNDATIFSWVIFLIGIFISFKIFSNCISIATLHEHPINNFNKKNIYKLAKQHEWIIVYDDKQYLVVSIPSSGWSWGEQLTIVYTDTKLLINAISFLRFTQKSFVHVSKCQNMVKNILEEIDESA